MDYFLFNLEGDPEQAAGWLDAKVWGVDGDERHGPSLAPGDVALIYLATARAFIGRVELATAVRDRTPSEAGLFPGDLHRGVSLSRVEGWDPAVPMDAAVHRIDPRSSNPLVKANAAVGFRGSVVRITADEYEAVLALSREARAADASLHPKRRIS